MLIQLEEEGEEAVLSTSPAPEIPLELKKPTRLVKIQVPVDFEFDPYYYSWKDVRGADWHEYAFESFSGEVVIKRTLNIGVHFLYTDQNAEYKWLAKKNYKHESVNHSVGEYIKDQAHTNGVESFWSRMKRGYVGVYHQMSEKHLQRYVDEYVGRHNGRQEPTMGQVSVWFKLCSVRGLGTRN